MMFPSVGAELARARQERKLSFAEVTRETKIQPWVLEALEADRLQDMMSPVYVKGFLSTYARFLRLDPEPLVGQIRWPQPEPAQDEAPPPPPPTPLKFRLPLPPVPVLRRIGAAALVCAAVIGLVVVKPSVRMAQGSKASPAKPTQAVAVRQAKPAKPAAASKPTTPAPSQAMGPVGEPVAPKLASVSGVSEPLKVPSTPTVALLATQPLELRVSAHRTTWIRVRADGKLLSQQRLQRGANERWTAKKQFELIISKPSQVEVTLNGQPISPFAIAHQGRLLITHHGITQLPEE